MMSAMVLESLERITVASVAITSRVLAETRPELTFLGWRVVVILGESGVPLRLRDVARHLGASAPSTSRLIRRLERKGLVQTAADVDDRRGLRISLSEEGGRLRDAVVDRRRELLAQTLAEPLPRELDAGLQTIGDRLGPWI